MFATNKNQTTTYEYIPCSRFKLVVYSLRSGEFVIYKEKKKSLVIVRSHDQLCISKAKFVRFLIGI